MNGTKKQNQAGEVFESGRLRAHLKINQPTPLTRRQLAEIALREYGPIQSDLVCRRLSKKPDDVARWVAKIRFLEGAPAARALADVSAHQLCELLGIKRIEKRLVLDERRAA